MRSLKRIHPRGRDKSSFNNPTGFVDQSGAEEIAPWVLNLECSARDAKSLRVAVSRKRLIQLCHLVRLSVGMLNKIDKGDVEGARLNLASFKETLEQE